MGDGELPATEIRMPQSIHIVKKTNTDSISFGSASKGGIIKIYADFSDVEDFKKKIDNAIEVRKYAQQQTEMNL